jgi:hypothetical protein
MEAVKTKEIDQTQELTGAGLEAQIEASEGTSEIGAKLGPGAIGAGEAPLTEVDDATLLVQLEDRLKKGTFPVTHLSPKRLKLVSTFLKDKAKYKGTQESYFLVAAMGEIVKHIALDVAAKLSEQEQNNNRIYEINTDVLKILNYLMSKHEGTGGKSAEDFLSYAQPVMNAVHGIKTVEDKIKELREKIGLPTPETQPTV